MLFRSLEHFGYLPPERVLMLCTGSQGEPRAGLSRIADDQHPLIYLERGDTVLFSARMIPGNEIPFERVLRRLTGRGIQVITPDDALIHASGHPRQDELRRLYEWTHPRYVLPVHGTPEKMEAHAQLAEAMGLGAVRVRNGQLVRLAPGAPRLLDEVRVGRVERVDERSASAEADPTETGRRGRGRDRRRGGRPARGAPDRRRGREP